MKEINIAFENIILLEKKLMHLRTTYWLQHNFGTANWWILLMLLLTSWVVFYWLLDRKRIMAILLYGAIITIITTTLDEIGAMLTLWEYPVKLVPLFPRLVPLDLGLVPVIYMLLYQYYQSWKSFVLASFVLSLIGSFGIEPLLEYLGIYKAFGWKHIYSFPIYVIMAVSTKYIVDRSMKINEKANSQHSR